MTSSFSDEFKKYQKQERRLTVAIVLVSVLAPVAFSLLLERKFHWMFCGITALMFLVAAVGLHVYRAKVSQKLLKKYENLEVGSVLAKKISPKAPSRFVITNTGYNHFYLRCLNTGEQVLVSKHRVREDFDIAN
ncbi:hypothetical protein B9G69_014550 [Bdellovibrio sp. SKB1291214]|uniref:hypothetical protein n=1 Tax=Bdellovibrio sp. SKB1291214 TaxID=1732569 RepID=UPI000B51BE8A|nr:hypothetical protein [Bdellovibrio sp. SKB1291214]UYL08266.1 hypothetical protein B9G69_014550 [Bdellovibrio sp. SKB1291214]